MYKIVSKEDTIRIPAEYMRRGASLDQHRSAFAMTAFEERFDEQNRFVLVTSNHEAIGRGRIIHGDGAIYQKVKFDAVVFCMEDYEVVEGAVSEINEFGAFIRIGPMEALLHKSQIMEDMVDVTWEPASSKVARVASVWPSVHVRARIVSLSPDTAIPPVKIGLTCKQPGLGSQAWEKDNYR